jgi:hypothetical protein
MNKQTNNDDNNLRDFKEERRESDHVYLGIVQETKQYTYLFK